MEELEHALKEYNMDDEKTIKEIIAEVDTDRVCGLCPQILLTNMLISYIKFQC